MNDKDDHYYMEGDAVERQLDCVSRDEVVHQSIKMKIGKAHGPSYVSLEFIGASREIGHQVMFNLLMIPVN